MRLNVLLIESILYLTGISSALLSICLSNFRAICEVLTRIPCCIQYPEPVEIEWQSSGNTVQLELRSQCILDATRERIVGSQCASSGLPVCFQLCRLPLDCHWDYWVIASASVVPVASQCTRSSGGLPCVPIMQRSSGLPLEDHQVTAWTSVVPVLSVQWYLNVLPMVFQCVPIIQINTELLLVDEIMRTGVRYNCIIVSYSCMFDLTRKTKHRHQECQLQWW